MTGFSTGVFLLVNWPVNIFQNRLLEEVNQEVNKRAEKGSQNDLIERMDAEIKSRQANDAGNKAISNKAQSYFEGMAFKILVFRNFANRQK